MVAGVDGVLLRGVGALGHTHGGEHQGAGQLHSLSPGASREAGQGACAGSLRRSHHIADSDAESGELVTLLGHTHTRTLAHTRTQTHTNSHSHTYTYTYTLQLFFAGGIGITPIIGILRARYSPERIAAPPSRTNAHKLSGESVYPTDTCTHGRTLTHWRKRTEKPTPNTCTHRHTHASRDSP